MAVYEHDLGKWTPEHAAGGGTNTYRVVPDINENGESDTVILRIMDDFGAAGTPGQPGYIALIMGGGQNSQYETDTLKVELPEGWSFRDPEPNPNGLPGQPHAASLYSAILDENGATVGTIAAFYPNRLIVNGEEVFRGVHATCFTRGTLIETPLGPRAVEDLRPGDLVLTADHGARPVRWNGCGRLDGGELGRMPNLRPIRIAAGALGPGVPARELIVSPQHRMLARSAHVRAMFGVGEVLVAAKQLLALDGVETVAAPGGVEYRHLLLDRHEILFAHGAETESFHLGRQALRSLAPVALALLLAVFPDVLREDYTPHQARILLRGKAGRALAARHGDDGTPLVASRLAQAARVA